MLLNTCGLLHHPLLHPHPSPQSEAVVLREPFSAFSVIEVAWFLRLAYCLDESQADLDLQHMGSCLSAVLRLAHALDAPRLLKNAERHIAGGAQGAHVWRGRDCICLHTWHCARDDSLGLRCPIRHDMSSHLAGARARCPSPPNLQTS